MISNEAFLEKGHKSRDMFEDNPILQQRFVIYSFISVVIPTDLRQLIIWPLEAVDLMAEEKGAIGWNVTNTYILPLL
jgi:hypothetical protein